MISIRRKRSNPTKDCFYRYIKTHFEKPLENLSNVEIKQIITRCNALAVESVIKDPGGFKLPASLGHICINKFKSKNLAVDAYNSKIFKKKIPHVNLHSFGYRFAIRFLKRNESKANTIIKNFVFRPSRSFTRSLAKYIKETGGEHFSNYKSNHFVSKKKLNNLSSVEFSKWD